jgi:hypothetical protein
MLHPSLARNAFLFYFRGGNSPVSDVIDSSIEPQKNERRCESEKKQKIPTKREEKVSS